MKKNKKMIIFAIVTLGVILVFRYFINKPSAEFSTAGNEEETAKSAPKISYPSPKPPTNNTTTAQLPDVGGNGTLSYGSKNRQVYWLQSYYNEIYAVPRNLPRISLDGVFGNETKSAVLATVGTGSITVSTTWNKFKKWVDDKNKSDASDGGNYWLTVAESLNI